MLTQKEIKETLEKFLPYKEKDVVAYYQDYINNYRNSNNLRDSFSNLKNISKLIDYNTFNSEIITYFKKIDIYTYFGEIGFLTFTQITAANPLDRNSTAASIDKFITELKERIRRIDFILETLNNMQHSLEKKTEVIPTNNAILTVKFQNDCNIKGLKELSEVSDDWNKLFRELYLLNDTTPEESIEFRNIRKGCLEIDFLSTVEFIKNFFQIYTFLITNMTGFFQLKELINRPQQKPLYNDDFLKAFEKQAETINNNCVMLTLEQMKETGYFKIDKGQENNVTRLILTKLLIFIEQGGDINLYTNSETPEEKELEQLFQIVVKKIENQRNQNLVNKNPDIEKLS